MHHFRQSHVLPLAVLQPFRALPDSNTIQTLKSRTNKYVNSSVHTITRIISSNQARLCDLLSGAACVYIVNIVCFIVIVV